MANLSVNSPFAMKCGPASSSSYYNHNILLNQTNSRNHPAMDMLGLISEITPSSRRRLDVRDEVTKEIVSSNAIDRNDDPNFKIYLDVGVFSPKELTVKIENDHLVIEGKHEENQSDEKGSVYRHFIRRFELPVDYNPEDIVSELSANGVVSIIMPKTTEPKTNEQPIETMERAGPHDVF